MTQINNSGQFVIRVYGILLNDYKEVLLSDEYRFGMKMTKFPGGGLVFGEGPEDCMVREALEELGQPVEITSHFYTTGFFQKAMFYDNHQLLSIYYRIKLKGDILFNISTRPFDFDQTTEGSQSFRWKNLNQLRPEDLSFPVDRHVAGMLIRQSNQGLI